MQLILNLLDLLTIAAQIIIAAIIIFLIIDLIFGHSAIKKLKVFILEHAIPLALIVALTATLGSLFYSEVMHWDPCKLCWYQRIFMYPQVIILGVALFIKDKKVWRYIIPLCIIGGAIALYQYFIQIIPSEPGICSINSPEDCSQVIIKQYGYITIPLMAFTAFVFNFILGVLALKHNK